ncbi:thiamine pyrophosphate-binding protein [Methanocalculus taiwanensis]|uniref:Thiamine pyrophosphate-binding protein n=1 Tax=Methanocalculus taiwanensis TaxID=106207 RepID=A0ABD4TIC4_9EURY|nr:thiamine pyrophosphate-binding protein [Methanocalculus taiwanensis]MCQ1538476.1 thiamine pyrophosphate-binding protein [Methanocalculus taiwanensis]
MKCTVAELIFDYLEQQGIDHIFGVPGLVLEPFLAACRKKGTITPILAKHEEGAAFMADGYARVKGLPGVCFATSGPGVTNLISGVAGASLDGIPLLVFSGQIPTFTNRKGTLQDSTGVGIDSVKIFETICKSSMVLSSPHAAEYDLRSSYIHAMTGRKGPVHLSLPKDILMETIEISIIEEPFTPPVAEYFDRKRVIEATRELCIAEKPAMLVGSGAVASGASQEIVELAEMFRIPVATTPKAKGAFPEDHPLALGVLGLGGSPLAECYIKSSEIDVLLVVGSSLNQISTFSWDPAILPSKTLININIDPTIININYTADIPLIGDAQTVISEISFRALRYLDEQEEMIEKRYADFQREKQHQNMVVDPEKMMSDQVPIKPQRLIFDLQNGLPKDAILFSDVGSHLLWALHYLKMTRPGQFIAPFGLLTMGFGTAAPIGGKLAAPDRPVVAIVGDGCFGMNGMEIATAVNYNLPIVWIVMNNSMLGLIHAFQSLSLGEDTILTRFRRIDFAKLAGSLGAVGITITEPGELARLLPEAIASGKPTVFDCLIDPDEKPPITSFATGARDYAARTLH